MIRWPNLRRANKISFEAFKTLKYEGAWIPYDGDRMRFRFLVEKYLQEALSDLSGKLVVGESGPEWNGKETLAGLSYSHSAEWGVVVFSRMQALGVDLEKSNRLLKKDYLKLSKRFFHSTEYESLKKELIFDGHNQFLELWMQKEAYSKMKRKHLVEFIHLNVSENALFEPLMKTRENYRAVVCLGK